MGNEVEDKERLAVVEEQIRQLVKGVTRLNEQLDSWQQNYVPRQEIDERFRSRDEDIRELREGFEAYKQQQNNDNRQTRSNVPVWVASIVSALMFLITLYTVISAG